VKRRHLLCLALLCLALLVACDDPPAADASPGDDAGTSTDVAPQPVSIDGGTDASPRPDAASGACVADATVQFAEAQISLRSWARDRAAPVEVGFTVMGRLCGQLQARSGDPIVGAALTTDAVRVWVNHEALRSGRHQTQIEVGTVDGPPLATLTVNLEAWAPAPADAPRHALLIGIDGVRSDGFQAAHTPNLDRLARAGDWTVEATTQLQGATLSGPGWGSILSGVDVDKHGVTNNGDVRLDPAYPSFLTRVRRELGLPTAAALQWAPLLTMVGEEALDEGTTGDQGMVVADMVRMLGQDYRALFIHFDDVDHAGHASGFSPQNPEYIAAIESVDAAIGALMEAILARPTVADEAWLVVTTTDHGGRGTGHGPRDREHRRIPFIVSGPTVVTGTMGGASHTDAAPTILAHMGYPPDPALNLDGRPRGLPGEFVCNDAIDDDGDGDLDCDDADCYSTPACGGGLPESACQNSRDDDHDGLVDCADPDCAETAACNVECVAEDLGGAVGRAVFSGHIGDERAALASSCGGEDGPEKALRWRVPADDVYLFDTFDSDFILREGDCVGPELACNDDAFGSVRQDTPLPTQSAVRLAMTADQEVTLVIDSEVPGGGNAVLDITPMGANCPDEDLGNTVGDGVARGNNGGRPTRYLGSCAGTARDAVYVWTAPGAGDYVFDTFGSDTDTVLFIMEGACGERELACNDDARGLQSSVTLNVEQGAVYTIVISGFRGRNGDYQLNVTAP
jgi:hypothetical protein